MDIPGITAVAPAQASALFPTDEVGPLAPRQAIGAATGPAAGGFGELFAQGLAGVNGQLLASQADLQQLAAGEAPNLHQLMIRLEESRVSFQLMMQVRGRLLEAYQDIMRMQV